MILLSKKKRHELIGNKIRASYGHSIKDKILKKVSKPPEYLYHATKQKVVSSIFKKGLLPMGRQYVHLSEKKEDAITVALRKTKTPILLRIESRKAFLKQKGNFYKEANNLWLADEINPKFIKEVKKD